MASLREVKNRIGTVKSTRKITSAMRMVSSAKLTKVEQLLSNMLPYQNKLEEIVRKILGRGSFTMESPYTESRKVSKVALVPISSNSSLCGGFNSSIIRTVNEYVEKNKASIGVDNILIYPVGRKVEEALQKKNYNLQGSYQELADRPSYKAARLLAQELMSKYVQKEIDQVIIVYYYFKSVGSQTLLTEQFLPIDLSKYKEEKSDKSKINYDYIVEPSEQELIENLIPQVLNQKFYTTLMDSNASAEAARSLAMQLATDNADDLIQDLTQQFNKSRQQAITNELLDIVGGSMR